jgi:hypothetical protein
MRELIRLVEDEESNTFSVESDIKFWSEQMSEHALFLHLGMSDEKLKARGFELHENWEKFRKDGHDQSKINPLMKDLKSYKEEIIRRMKKGEWIGLNFLSLVEHLLRELNYLQDKMDGKIYTAHQEMVFWNEINADHADFAAHLMDINETKNIETATSVSVGLRSTNTNEKALPQYKALDKFVVTNIKSKTLNSVIHPALMDHIEREGKRSIETLNKVK